MGQAEAPGVPAESGRSNALLWCMLPYLTQLYRESLCVSGGAAGTRGPHRMTRNFPTSCIMDSPTLDVDQ